MSCIWYVSKYIALPSAGRGGTRAFMLMREMTKLGHRCLILTSDANHLTNVPEVQGTVLLETADGVDVGWIRTAKFTGANSMRRILSWLDFEWRLWRLPKSQLPKPDVVIVSSLSLLTIFNGLWLKRRYGCRLVFEVRDIWPLTLIEEGGFSAQNPFVMGLGWIERMAYRHADEIVGTMPNLKEHVEQVTDKHSPVHCIPFGVDPDMIAKSESVSTDWVEAHIPKDKFLICHAGTIGITNALDTLFECARAMQDHTDIHFLMVGEGGLRSHYEAQCADLPNVTFTGPVPKGMVLSVLAKCDILYFAVHVSKVWKYGLSLNKVMDYMLAGKPIVASYAGYPSMVDEAASGTSVPPGDALALKTEILRLAALPSEDLTAIGARGREWILENRRFDKLARDYLALALPQSAAAVSYES